MEGQKGGKTQSIHALRTNNIQKLKIRPKNSPMLSLYHTMVKTNVHYAHITCHTRPARHQMLNSRGKF